MEKVSPEQRDAGVISYILHPLLVPMYSLLLIYRLQTFSNYLIPDPAKWLILAMTGIATIAFPILILLLFVRKGIVSSLRMEKREDRLYPCLIVSVVYYVMYLLFNSICIPVLVSGLYLGVASMMLITLVVNFKWKISIHMIASGGMFGMFTGIAIRYELNIIWLLAVMILLAGLNGYARLRMNAHTHPEIYSGFLAGTAGMLLVYLLV